MPKTIDALRTTHYREKAFDLRLRIIFTQSDELRDFYEKMATDFERLADEAEAEQVPPLAQGKAPSVGQKSSLARA